jgi:hypothetical protein
MCVGGRSLVEMELLSRVLSTCIAASYLLLARDAICGIDEVCKEAYNKDLVM